MAETSRGQPRGRGWPRGLILVALLGALLLVSVGIYVVGLPRHEASQGGSVDPDADLSQLGNAIQAIFAEGPCPSAAQASSAVGRVLTDLGYSDWSINLVSGVATDDCVGGAALAADTREVILLPALSAAVRSALERVQENSYANCLTERQVADMLIASLAELGHADFDIRTSGRLVAPTDHYEEVENHVLSGCWVYSASAASADGTRTFLLTGPPPDYTVEKSPTP